MPRSPPPSGARRRCPRTRRPTAAAGTPARTRARRPRAPRAPVRRSAPAASRPARSLRQDSREALLEALELRPHLLRQMVAELREVLVDLRELGAELLVVDGEQLLERLG